MDEATGTRKLRRILLLHEGETPHEWKELLQRYTHDVTHVSVDNYAGEDYLTLDHDCLIVDGRIKDLTAAGYFMATALRNPSLSPWIRLTLYLYDPDRVSQQELEQLQADPRIMCVPYQGGRLEADIDKFIVRVHSIAPHQSRA